MVLTYTGSTLSGLLISLLARVSFTGICKHSRVQYVSGGCCTEVLPVASCCVKEPLPADPSCSQACEIQVALVYSSSITLRAVAQPCRWASAESLTSVVTDCHMRCNTTSLHQHAAAGPLVSLLAQRVHSVKINSSLLRCGQSLVHISMKMGSLMSPR